MLSLKEQEIDNIPPLNQDTDDDNEEIENGKRIMRPAYRTLIKNRDYVALDER